MSKWATSRWIIWDCYKNESHHFDYSAMPNPKLTLDTDASFEDSVWTILHFL